MRPVGAATIALAGGLTAAAPTFAQTLLEQSSEHRFQLDFHVNDAALQKMLPAGWEQDVASAGAAKDANIRMIFIDRVVVLGPDGKTKGKGSSRLVYLAAPVKKGEAKGQMILGGLTDNSAEAPGAFGNFLSATTARMSRAVSSFEGAAVDIEDWDFSAASGEHMEVHVTFERGPASKGGGETKFYDPADPAKYQTFKTEQAIDIARNVSVSLPDHVKAFAYKAGGGKLATLFDGTEKVLSWDSFPWYVRSISGM